ncbi:MAG TPA: DUF2169 domain-containing protein [Smithellaceae bacterium]|jgi:hypothetical protein|nr:DUF2169 domain-containing protein [Smithella sp.]HPL97841.1 DUF2169 domain-containing protein [Smithellaceae bacterium]HPV49947.1 DUF2169 domain-containing protein [Smithellaceae bacterium]
MFHLRNDTPFPAQIYTCPNLRGLDTLYIVVKQTYDLMPSPAIAETQQPIIEVDQYWDEPGRSSLKYAGEIHLEKPGTDVVLIGEACSPNGRPVTEMNVGISVAGREHILKIFGDRRWKKGFLSFGIDPPRPFTRMPLRYERAFGGMHIIDETSANILAEKKNPVGKGFTGRRSAREIDGMELPNIEDPADLIKSPTDTPAPACFGYVAPNWEPRINYVGTYDETWRKTIMPGMPEDFDPRFYHMAHPGLIFSPHLKGGEPVILVNLSEQGRLNFTIPEDEPKIEANINGRFETAKANLETILLEPMEERMCLLWRAALPGGKKIPGAEVEVTI